MLLWDPFCHGGSVYVLGVVCAGISKIPTISKIFLGAAVFGNPSRGRQQLPKDKSSPMQITGLLWGGENIFYL